MANIGVITTFADRLGIVEDTINSVAEQLDLLLIYCNDAISYELGRLTKLGHVKKYFGANITDRGKFYFCKEFKNTDNVYFTFDDDIIFAPDYVEKTLAELERYNYKAIVSYHGKKLITRPIDKYYRPMTDAEERHDYKCLGSVMENKEVDIIGTGCMAFHLDYFCPTDLREDMMADIEVSALAFRQGKRCIVLAHPHGFIRYNGKMGNKWTIWDEYQTRDDKKQVELINKTWKR